MGCRAQRRLPQERGAAAVEFALVLPILLLIVFGIIQYGLYFWAMQGGSDVARDAARRSAIGDPQTCAEFRTAVRADLNGLTGESATATVNRRYVDDDGTAGVSVGDSVEVFVSFQSFDLKFPFLPFIDDGRVSTTAISRVENLPDQTAANWMTTWQCT